MKNLLSTFKRLAVWGLALSCLTVIGLQSAWGAAGDGYVYVVVHNESDASGSFSASLVDAVGGTWTAGPSGIAAGGQGTFQLGWATGIPPEWFPTSAPKVWGPQGFIPGTHGGTSGSIQHVYYRAVPDDNDRPPPCPEEGSCCSGMPVWRVSEPYINLWIDDEPLGYQPASGPRISLTLSFKQREHVTGADPQMFSLGRSWNFSWLSYVADGAGLSNYNVVYLPGGGSRIYTNSTDYLTNTRLTGNTNSGYTVSYPDGSADVYSFVVTNGSGAFIRALMTERRNPAGQRTRLDYENYTASQYPVIRLKYVVDGDGRTNSVYYNATNAYSTNLISQVVDAFGRTNSLGYDSNGRLTNITDVAGLPSSFTYDANDMVTTMSTLYGTTTFVVNDVSTNIPNGRYVLVTEPNGAGQLLLYTNSAPGIAASYPTNQVPNTNPSTNGFENSELNLRNTFHWNRAQYGELSTTNIGALTTNDFAKAHMKHWLRAETSTISESLSLERAASQDEDGVTPGHLTWYDYAGKTNASYIGSQAQPLFVARVLPGGTNSWYTRTDRNAIGHVTTNINTYSVGSAVSLRTNVFTFATNDVDLVKYIRKNGAVDELVSSNYFNTNHLVLTNYNALNELTTYDYNANQQLVRVKFPNGLMTTNIYNTNNLLVTTIDFTTTENLRTNSYTYTNGLVYTHSDPRGLTVTNTWDALQRLLRVNYPDGTGITNTYDKLDLVQVVDRMGFTNLFSYNSIRQKIRETNALGIVTAFGYCQCGTLEYVTNAFGVTGIEQVTHFVYDNHGNTKTVFNADNTSVTNLYDSLGRLTNSIDSFGTSVTNYYNNQGLLATASNYFGRVLTTAFDFEDRATNTVDANGVSINTTYDVLGRVVTKTYPDNGVEKFVFTANIAGPTSYTNQLGSNVVNYAYDALGRKTNDVYPGIATNKFTYSAAGDLRTLTDGRNQITAWGYDSYGRTTSKTNQTGTEILRYQYDANSRLTNRWSAAKSNTVYAYDKVGNLTNVNYSVSPDITLQYDALSRLTNMVDAAGTTGYTYNSANQLLAEDGPWASDTVTFGYNNQLRSSLTLLQPNASSWTQIYGYDPAKRLTNTASQAGSFTYVYDSTRQTMANKLTLPGGSYITNAFDSVARLSGTWLKNSGNTNLNSHLYGYNLAGQRTALTNIAGNRLDYTYDLIGELKTARGYESGGASRLHEKFGYAYDAAGNLNQRTNNALLQTFGVNNLNELTTVARNTTNALTVVGTTTSTATNVTVNSLTATRYTDNTFAKDGFTLADGNNTFTAVAQDSLGRSDTNAVEINLPATVSFQYDLNGNLTSDGRRGFDYDDENQLIRITVTNSWKSEFTYDATFRRRIRKEYAWIGGAWAATNEVRYVYEVNLVIQERNGNNIPNTSYTRGHDLSGSFQSAGGIGGLLSRSDQTTFIPTHASYHTDGNGNVTALVNPNQNVVAKYLYDPFGNTISKSGLLADANVYRFSSKEVHLNFGLDYYGYRFYDSNLQRWLNKDPLGEPGFERQRGKGPDILGDGPNSYRFLGNNPTRLIDPFGLCKQCYPGSPYGHLDLWLWYFRHGLFGDNVEIPCNKKKPPPPPNPCAGEKTYADCVACMTEHNYLPDQAYRYCGGRTYPGDPSK